MKKENIGIVGLGWLGKAAAMNLQQEGYTIWGTKRERSGDTVFDDRGIEVITWQSESSISEELNHALKKTDMLILNLPPSVFKKQTYATGLLAFVSQLPEEAKVIFTSSTGVYPEHLTDAREDYIFEKEEKNALVEAEETLRQLLGNRLCILRLAGLIDEDRHPIYFLAKKSVNSDPDKPINLIHRKDILKVISQVIQEDHFGEIFNVCNPKHPSRKEYYSQVAAELRLPKLYFSSMENKTVKKIVNCFKLQEKLKFHNFESLFIKK